MSLDESMRVPEAPDHKIPYIHPVAKTKRQENDVIVMSNEFPGRSNT